MSYRNLEIWKLSRSLVVEIHQLTLELPRFEMYEEGQQIRRSSKSVKSNIVEGYGRKRYKREFIKFIIYALASNDETIDHLENLFETGSFQDEALYHDLHKRLNKLGVKINNFLSTLEKD